jgi:hypothetical protein
MLEMGEFVKQNDIKMTCEEVSERPGNMKHETMNHYKCLLQRGSKRLTVYFSQGYGIKGDPDVLHVLGCVASDSAGFEDYDLDSWLAEFGYTESLANVREGEEIYREVETQSKKLRRFLGEDLFQELLYNVEPF